MSIIINRLIIDFRIYFPTIRTSQVQLINSKLNFLMCDPIGSILSGNEIYCDLHHNIIETLFDRLKYF